MQSSSETWTKQTWSVTPAEKTYPKNWKDLHKNPWQAELPQNIFCDFPEREIKKVHYDSGQLLVFFFHCSTGLTQTLSSPRSQLKLLNHAFPLIILTSYFFQCKSLLFLHLLYKANLAYSSVAYPDVGLLKAGAHFNIYGHRDPLPDYKRILGMSSCAISLIFFIHKPKNMSCSFAYTH